MAAAPKIKVFDAAGKYQASVKEYEAGAALMALYGNGSTIRMGHSKNQTVWTEGPNGNGIAAESWDYVAEVCHEKWTEMCVAGWRKAGLSEDQIAEWMAG